MDKIQKFAKESICKTDQPYWNQYKDADFIMETVEKAADDRKAFNALELCVGTVIGYINSKDKKMQDRNLKRLFTEIDKALCTITGAPHRSYLTGGDHPIMINNVSFAVFEHHAFIFNERKLVLQFDMALVNIWLHLLPYMLRIKK